MTRQRVSLDGFWSFRAATDPATARRTVTVPGVWQAQFADLAERPGKATYHRNFGVPAEWAGSALILHFGAVDYWAEVWVNEQRVGAHEGGYLPFEFDIAAYVRAGGQNTLRVEVADPGDEPPAGVPPFSQVPHGKQSWYGAVGGLWQSVWLERRARVHFKSVALAVAPDEGRVTARLPLAAPMDMGQRVEVSIRDAAGTVVAKTMEMLGYGETEVMVTLSVPSPQWWSPDAPHLYRLEAALWQGQEVQDETAQSFGFRTIVARDGALYLNGERLYLRAALDQNYYPETFYTVPSAAYVEDEMRKAKQMGLNCLRCHIKIADPAYLEAADRLGVLIWAELPNWKHFTRAVAERAYETLKGMVARDGHHPSLIIWTIINEGWGLDLKDDAGHRAWLKEAFHWMKALDPTRLVVDNSACEPNFHLESDLDDFHYYAALPDHRERWDTFVEKYATRPDWTYSPFGDTTRTGREPLLVSEFGNWGLPDANGLLTAAGREPWWFETGLEWGDGIMYPHGVQDRFRRFDLGVVFGSWEAFIAAGHWHQYAALKYQIEVMRRQANIVGYVVTEFTDLHWECNGLLDFKRQPKAHFERLADINADLVIIPTWTRTAYWAGERIELALSVSHGAGPTLTGATLAWRGLGSNGTLPLPTMQAGEVLDAHTLRLTAPDVQTAAVQRLELEVQARDGSVVARSYLDFSLLPPPAQPGVTVWADSAKLAEHLRGLGYAVADTPAEAGVLVAQHLTPGLRAAVRAGALLVLLADTEGVLAETLDGVRLVARAGSVWAGDWALALSWLRRDGLFGGVPGGPLLDHSFDRVIPEYVVVGLQPLDFAPRVAAGLLVGWIHKLAALIATLPTGQGQFTVSTFRLLRDAPGADPVATTLLHGLIATAAAQ